MRRMYFTNSGLALTADGADLPSGMPVSVAEGGTGASDAAGARTNLGVSASGADTAYAFRANNLSDLANAAAARTNLGLGNVENKSSATIRSEITSANVTTALSYAPLNPASNLSDVASVATARSNLGVSATGADANYPLKTNNLSDLANIATARSNLGVTASGADTAYAWRTNNLSDLANAGTARTNLGLGTAAVKNTGTSGNTVPLLDASNSFSGAQTTFLNPGDAATAIVVSGATMGLRFGTSAIGGSIDGVDKTGSASYQPLQLGGSMIVLKSNNAERARLEASNLLVGYTTSNGAYLLQVNSQIFATNATIATSDATVKRELPPLSQAVLERISKIPVRFYERIDRPQDGARAGYFAQDWEAVFGLDTGIVRRPADLLQLDEGAAHALKIAALEQRLATLEARLAAGF